MGTDKGALIYADGLDQRTRCFELLRPFCSAGVSVSMRREQLPYVSVRWASSIVWDEGLATPESSVRGTPVPGGPAVGILAVAQKFPDDALLVLACDFPWAGEEDVARLLNARETASKAMRGAPRATAYAHPDGTIEPLFAIWEAGALGLLAEAFGNGERSPRSLLAQMDREGRLVRVAVSAGKGLINVNSRTKILGTAASS